MPALDASSSAIPRRGDRRSLARRMHVLLAVLCAGSMLASLAIDPAGTSLRGALAQLLRGDAIAPLDAVILLNIRMPRMVLGALVGASLAVSGTVTQGLFGNPLADPGIIGISASAIVLSASLPLWLSSPSCMI